MFLEGLKERGLQARCAQLLATIEK